MRTLIDRLVAHYTKTGPVVLLESQSPNHPASRYSYLAAAPASLIKARGNRIEIFENKNRVSFQDNPWNALATYRKKRKRYLFGYLGYDMKNHTEALSSNNTDKVNVPDLFFMEPSVLLKINNTNKTVKEITNTLPANLAPAKQNKFQIENLCNTISRKKYISIIQQIQRDIYEGSYYELNFTHQLEAGFAGPPYALYQKMRQAGPVPFGAYMAFDDVAVCCASPERFLQKKGRKICSQPIKGTIKRVTEEIKNEQLKHKLLHSAKNRAENMMIVDLVRNDLSRIARQGTVKVSNLFEIQSFTTVNQMVSTINAASFCEDPIEIIKACFPMGSMTGAPKISVMKAIERYENYRRGIYSGAIGYFTPDDNFDFNVVIRTAIIKGGKLFYAAGGAITGDSDAGEEWDETQLKTAALTDTLSGG